VSECWARANWRLPENIVAGYTLRNGGVSQGPYRSLNIAAHVGDDPAAVAANRHRFAEACQLPGEPLWLNQVHGTVVVRGGRRGGDADAIVSTADKEVCVIQTADCLPILLVTADGSAVAAAHAGWRGLADGVLESSIAALDAAAGRILAWIGPAISQEAFEVGEEVRARFVSADERAASCFARNPAGRWQADLCGLARQRLEAMGVSEIAAEGRCTFNEPDAFFSYRRDGECGRMASFIYRREVS